MPRKSYVVLFVKKDLDPPFVLLHEEVRGMLYLLITTSQYHEVLHVVRTVCPDLFVFENHLAEMSGLHLYDLLHQHPRLEHIPALLLYEESLSTQLSQQIVARDVLSLKTKPLQAHALLERLENYPWSEK